MAPKGMRSFERNHYFYGKLMTARDFKAEQEYHREKQWLHTRLAHDFGVVGGLRISSAGDAANPWRLVLHKGVAVDAEGREIVITEDHEFDLSKLMFQCGLNPSRIQKPVYLTLSYTETEGEPVPVYARDGAADDGFAANRVSEGYVLAVTDQLPPLGESVAQKLFGIVDAALKPMDLGSAYARTGGLGLPPAGAASVAAAADSDDLLAGTFDGALAWVTGEGLAREDVTTTDGKVVAIATAPGVAWIATKTTVRMAWWPAGSAPSLTLSWNDQSISTVAAHPFAETDLHAAYYLAVIPDINMPDLMYWRLAKVTSDGTMLELQKLEREAKGLAVAPDGKTLFFAQKEGEGWNLMALDLGTNTVTVELAGLAEEPVSLHAGTDAGGEQNVVLVVSAGRYIYHTAGTATAKEMAMPHGFTVSAAALQGRRALLAGMDSVAGQPALHIYDLADHRRITYMWLLGAPRCVSALAAPSYRVYVGTNQGVEMIDVPAQTNDLYRLLANRSLDLDVTEPAAATLVLAAVPLRNGLPDVSAIDNVTYRRVLVGSGDLLGILTGIAGAIAKGGFGQPTPSTQYSVIPEKVSEKVEDRKYTVRVSARVVDADGKPAPAGVAVTWALSSEKGDGSLMNDLSLTDPTGVALNTATGLSPDELYTITALVGGRGDSVQFKGDPIQVSYAVDVAYKDLSRQADGSLSANLTATILENDGPAPANLPVAWSITPADGATLDSTGTKTDAQGVSGNVIRKMKVGTTYTVTVAVAGFTGRTTVEIPAATPQSVALVPQPYTLHGGKLARSIKATVLDSWGFPIPGAPMVAWSGGPDFLSSTTSLDGTGRTEALALNLNTGATYTVTAVCGGAQATVNFTPRSFPMTSDLVHEGDGQYTAQFQVGVKNKDGGPAAVNEPVRWVLTGSGSLSADQSTTDGTGTATVQVTDLPVDAVAGVTALGNEGMGYAEVHPKVREVTFDTFAYAIRNGVLARRIIAVVRDDVGNMPHAPQVTWTSSAVLEYDVTPVDELGRAFNYVLNLAVAQPYTVAATCSDVTATLSATPQGYTMNTTAVPNSGGGYNYTITAGVGAAAGAGQTVTWVLQGAGTLSAQSSLTDAAGVASVQVLNLAQGQTAQVTALGTAGTGQVQIGTTIGQVTLLTSDYELIGGKLARKVTAVVLDSQNNPIPNAGTINWTSTGKLQSASTLVDAQGRSENYLLELTTGSACSVTAACGGATASLAMTPHNFVMDTVPSQQSDGRYSVLSRVTVTDGSGRPPATPQTVRWVLEGSGQLAAASSQTNAIGIAQVLVSNLALDQTAKLSALCAEGLGVLSVKPQVSRVAVEPAAYELRSGTLARPVEAAVTDNFGFPVKAALAVSWASNAGLDAASTQLGSDGRSINCANRLERSAAYTITATCAGVSGQLDMIPQDYQIDFTATVQADGSYNVAFTTWAKDADGNRVGAGSPINWVLSGNGQLASSTIATDGEGKATAAVTGLLLNQTARLTVLGQEGMGYQEVMPQVQQVTLAAGGYELRSNVPARKLTATVKDVWGQVIPAGTITWSGPMESASTVITSGTSSNYATNLQTGNPYTVTASFGGKSGSFSMTPRAYAISWTSSGTSIASDGSYTVAVSATVADESGNPVGAGASVNWAIVGGGQVVTATSSTNTSNIASSSVKSLALGSSYSVYALGAWGFGKLALAPVIQSINLSLGWLEAMSGMTRVATAVVKDNFGLGRPNATVTFGPNTNANPYDNVATATTDATGKATKRFALPSLATATVTATCGGVSATASRSVCTLTIGKSVVNRAGTYDLNMSLYAYNADGTVAANAPVFWTMESMADSGSIPSQYGTSASNGAIAQTATALLPYWGYRFTVYAGDGWGQLDMNRQANKMYLEFVRNTAATAMNFTCTMSDSYGALPGCTINWSNGTSGTTDAQGKATTTNGWDSSGNGSLTATLAQNTYFTLTQNYYWQQGGGNMTKTLTTLTAAQTTLTADATADQPEALPTTMESFARIASAPQSVDAVPAQRISLRSAGAIREEEGLYTLKVIATLKGTQDEPLVGLPVTWEGLPAEQIEALAVETDQFGTAVALVHGLSPEEVYGITAVAGEARDTLFADKSTMPDYYLTLTPLPVTKAGEAGFTIDLLDGQNMPVKGATVRYTIRGGEFTTAGKLVTSRAREPKPLVVMGLKAGTAYEIEASAKDVIAILRYLPEPAADERR